MIVRLADPTEIVVPTAAVKNAQQGNYVFVVKPDSTAEQRTVQDGASLGRTHCDSEWLESRRTVIVEGQLRVKSGGKVQIVSNRENGEGARGRSED